MTDPALDVARPDPSSRDGGEPRFTVGTLAYTRSAMLVVAFWMLWADLCLQIMEQLPTVIPLQLRAFAASDATVGFIKDSLTAILAVALVPFIGLQSDRHRGPLGRRRPFLLWCTLPVCAFLVALGFVDEITRYVFAILGPWNHGLTEAGTGIVLIGLFAGGFLAFNNYVLQIFQYMIADVLPRATLGRFFGVFRAVGALGGFIFNRWIFGYADGHVWVVYTVSAALYATAFLLLVWRVREGEYPAPPPRAGNPLAELIRYGRECYAQPFYLKLFCTSTFFWCAYVPFNTFIIFYATKGVDPTYAPTLGLDAAAFGRIKAWTFLPKIVVALMVGPLIDRSDALRVLAGSLVVLAILYLLGFFVARTPGMLTIWWVLNEAVVIVLLVAYLSIFPILLPADRYGQYFGANQVFFSVALIVVPMICGLMLQVFKDYSLIFLWSAASSGLGAATAIWLRNDWLSRDRIAPD